MDNQLQQTPSNSNSTSSTINLSKRAKTATRALRSQIATSISNFSEDWWTLRSSFAVVEASIAGRNRDDNELVQSKERERYRIVCLTRENEVVDRCEVLERVELREKEVIERELKVEERFRELELREKEVNEGFVSLRNEREVKRKEMVENRRLLVLQQRSLDEKGKTLEMRVEAKEKALKERELKVEEGFKALELKEKEVYKMFKVEMELKKEELMALRRELALKEKQLELKAKELVKERKVLDSEKGGVVERCGIVEVKEKEISDGLNDKEERANKRERELDLREQKINRSCVVHESREKLIKEQSNALELLGKQIEERCESLELKEKQMSERFKEVELKEEQLSKALEAFESKEMHMRESCIEMDSREKEINDRRKAVELKEETIKRQEIALGLREQHINERCRGQETRVNLINDRNVVFALGAKNFVGRCQSLELKDKQQRECVHALESTNKQVVCVENLKELDLKDMEIYDQCEVEEMDWNEQQIREQNMSQDESEAQIKFPVEDKQLISSSIFMESQAEQTTNAVIYRLCLELNGKALRLFLNERLDEHDLLREELISALKSSEDPATIVLEAVNGVFQRPSRRTSLAYDLSGNRKTCVLLLELVMYMKPYISDDMRKKALKAGNVWKQRLKIEGESELVVLGYLLFLTTFNLWSSCEMPELRRLYKIIDQCRVAPYLRSRLDFQ